VSKIQFHDGARPPLTAILTQNKRREKPVPENVIRELAEKCEPPTWAEAHGLVLYPSSKM
jgi:hypothetical protein